VQDTKSDKQIT